MATVARDPRPFHSHLAGTIPAWRGKDADHDRSIDASLGAAISPEGHHLAGRNFRVVSPRVGPSRGRDGGGRGPMSAPKGSDAGEDGGRRFVRSADALFGGEVPGDDCGWFSESPPLVLGAGDDGGRSMRLLKQKCRLGLPPQLRRAVWMSSVARVVNPHLPVAETDSYGTVAMEGALGARWDCALGAAFPNEGDREDAPAPDLGLGQEALRGLMRDDYREWNGGDPIPEGGRRSLTLVLCAARQVLGIEYCPPLPDVAAILLTHMPESYAFATIREMINDTSHFLPVSQREYYSWCKAYAHFVKRMFPKSYKAMKGCGALDPEGGLDPIFKRFFTTILKREDVLCFMDVFAVEGCKAVFRLALSLVQLVGRDPEKLMLTTAESWWTEVRYQTLDPTFSFKKHLDVMYPKWGKIAKRYPRRRFLRRAMKYHEKRAAENMPLFVDETPPRPMGYTNDECILAKPPGVRSNLARWLPPSLKATRLDLIYSTEVHGRSLASFFERCRRSRNAIVLVQAILEGRGTTPTIGMFATHAWSPRPSPFGDGECLLFRADPDPLCYNWAPDFSDDMSDTETAAAREQFMVAKKTYIAMGANVGGTNGLRLDQDLVKGESYPALGFDNKPLPGEGHERFEIGVLEVYQLVREIDGKAVGHDENLIWDLTGL